jgi:SAM-dependent methyltransferase
VPVLCNVLWPTHAEAVAAPTGAIQLALCLDCGLVSNVAFDATAVVYSPAYHNSLHGSPTFRRYAEMLARRLVDTYDLHAAKITEIGSGSGEFLSLLCELGQNTGTGFDPSHQSLESETVAIADETFGRAGAITADFVICQHVLEHVATPTTLLADLRATVHSPESDTAPPAYFEVPDATYMLEHGAVWDVIYEHCSYFSEPALRHLFTRCGYGILDHGRAFGDQYLWLEAVPSAEVTPLPATSDEIRNLAKLATAFAQTHHDLVTGWDRRLRAAMARGPVALWGAGSKGVSFLNAVPAARDIAAVVDVNQRKHGLHVPVTGHEVVAPQALCAQRPATVVVMNPLYADEIRTMLRDLDIAALVEVA